MVFLSQYRRRLQLCCITQHLSGRLPFFCGLHSDKTTGPWLGNDEYKVQPGMNK